MEANLCRFKTVWKAWNQKDRGGYCSWEYAVFGFMHACIVILLKPDKTSSMLVPIKQHFMIKQPPLTGHDDLLHLDSLLAEADGAVMHYQAAVTLFMLHAGVHSSQRRASVTAAPLCCSDPMQCWWSTINLEIWNSFSFQPDPCKSPILSLLHAGDAGSEYNGTFVVN